MTSTTKSIEHAIIELQQQHGVAAVLREITTIFGWNLQWVAPSSHAAALEASEHLHRALAIIERLEEQGD